MRREVAVVTDELSYSRAEVTKAKQKDGELAEMRRKLRAERSIRKACEKWLRSELRSREEMESLLGAIKDVAAGRVPSRDMGDVEGLIEEMKMLSGAKASVAGSLDSMRRVLEDDNSRLKAELAAARAMLNDKLRY